MRRPRNNGLKSQQHGTIYAIQRKWQKRKLREEENQPMGAAEHHNTRPIWKYQKMHKNAKNATKTPLKHHYYRPTEKLHAIRMSNGKMGRMEKSTIPHYKSKRTTANWTHNGNNMGGGNTRHPKNSNKPRNNKSIPYKTGINTHVNLIETGTYTTTTNTTWLGKSDIPGKWNNAYRTTSKND